MKTNFKYLLRSHQLNQSIVLSHVRLAQSLLMVELLSSPYGFEDSQVSFTR